MIGNLLIGTMDDREVYKTIIVKKRSPQNVLPRISCCGVNLRIIPGIISVPIQILLAVVPIVQVYEENYQEEEAESE